MVSCEAGLGVGVAIGAAAGGSAEPLGPSNFTSFMRQIGQFPGLSEW